MFRSQIFLAVLSYLFIAILSKHTRHKLHGSLMAYQENDVEMTEEGKRVCLNNDECHQEVTYCPTEDCCAYKECNSEGECEKMMSQGYKERYDDLNDDDCFWEENCYRNISSCSGSCCGIKECYNGECFVGIPSCIAPEISIEQPEIEVVLEDQPMTEEEKRICLNNNECHKNIIYCPTVDCCAYKECSANGECTNTISQCFKERYEDISDNDCFREPNCYRNITSCSDDCCGFKQCYNGDCFVAVPSCELEEPITERPQVTPAFEATSDEGKESSQPQEDNEGTCSHRYGRLPKAKASFLKVEE